ncbi:hypothetical protein B0H17DRAFT_1181194 [Mycena rosella]|uniref:Uncharacterized protein n=1 Tax=Mycena rosella TaxID=1033263 RepID=A0AAD7D9G6_MYCRO|nr:hypothetical protein B0H17DRAFT_1181194 [Mycena rosella]
MWNFMMIRLVGRNRKRVNDGVQLEADSTIGAGGYLEHRERVAATAHAPIVVQIAGQFALYPKYTKDGERRVNEVENVARGGWEVVMMVPVRSSSIKKLGEVDAGHTKRMSTDGEAEKELEMILPAESGIWSVADLLYYHSERSTFISFEEGACLMGKSGDSEAKMFCLKSSKSESRIAGPELYG